LTKCARTNEMIVSVKHWDESITYGVTKGGSLFDQTDVFEP